MINLCRFLIFIPFGLEPRISTHDTIWLFHAHMIITLIASFLHKPQNHFWSLNIEKKKKIKW